MLEGGEPDAMLGVMKVWRIMLLKSKLFLLFSAPHPSNDKLGAVIVLEVNAGNRLFSGSRPYLTLRLCLR